MIDCPELILLETVCIDWTLTIALTTGHHHHNTETTNQDHLVEMNKRIEEWKEV